MKLKNLGKGSWFNFDDDDPDSGRICIRSLDGLKDREFKKECTEKKVEYQNKGQFRHEFEVFDSEKYHELMMDYCIIDWEGLEDDDGNPLECNRKNKVELPLANPGFSVFIAQCLSKVNVDALTLKEKQEGN